MSSKAQNEKAQFLVFTLGENTKNGLTPVFGLDAYQVREVLRMPELTQLPKSPEGVLGMVSLRGSILPVLNLAALLKLPAATQQNILIVAEIAGRDIAFIADAVDTIVRLAAEDLREPPPMLQRSHLAAIVELPGGRLLQVLSLAAALDQWLPRQAMADYDAPAVSDHQGVLA